MVRIIFALLPSALRAATPFLATVDLARIQELLRYIRGSTPLSCADRP